MLRAVVIALLSTLTAVTASSADYDYDQDKFARANLLPLGITMEDALVRMKRHSSVAPTVYAREGEIVIVIQDPGVVQGFPEKFPRTLWATFKDNTLCSVEAKFRSLNHMHEPHLRQLTEQFGPPRIRSIDPSFVHKGSIEFRVAWNLGEVERGFSIYFFDLEDTKKIEIAHSLTRKGC
jgi:hypothetical protein